jgi:Cys-rich repeat protein
VTSSSTTTGSAGVTSSGTTTSGSTSAGTTTSGTTSAGSTTGTSAGNGSGTTGADTSTGGTAGTTGGIDLGGPFAPYDAGPRTEPSIDYDAGCTALQPIANGFNYPPCVQCKRSSDCATGLVCDTNQNSQYQYTCVQCARNSDCPAGDTCDYSDYTYPTYWPGTDTCGPDCRNNTGICAPGACDADAGFCYDNFTLNMYQYEGPPNYNYCYQTLVTGWCRSDSDCMVDGGGGACNFTTSFFPFYYDNGWGYCVPCKMDGGPGGCGGSDQFCQVRDCSTNGLPADGPAGSCVFNCFLDAGACGVGNYCTDAGPLGVDGGNVGGCVVGCQNSSNCAGSTPVCNSDGGGCVMCNSSSDCPDWMPGCQYNNCGSCATNADCPGSEQCNGACGCSMDSDCPLDVPTCIGGYGGYSGSCACTDGSQCPGGYVCETRGTYAVTNYGTYPYPQGGACILACATNADCASSFGGSPNVVCDTATGFCVPCAADTDCTASADPTKPYPSPSCVLYADGGNPNVTPFLATGGGQCGCSDTSQCNGGYSCQPNSTNYIYAYDGGPTCQPTCTYVNGIDSCTPKNPYYYYCNDNYTPPPFCNTYTGQCQQCLDDYDCTGRNCDQPVCNNGTCVQCLVDADCDVNPNGYPFCVNNVCTQCKTGDDCLNFPNNSCYYGYCNSYCNDSSNCPTDGGYVCETTPTYSNACLIECVMGDDAGMGTVSDAGNPCPANAALCVPNSFSSTQGDCAPNFPCDSNSDANNNCDAGYCSSIGFPFGYAYCETWLTCYSYCY